MSTRVKAVNAVRNAAIHIDATRGEYEVDDRDARLREEEADALINAAWKLIQGRHYETAMQCAEAARAIIDGN